MQSFTRHFELLNDMSVTEKVKKTQLTTMDRYLRQPDKTTYHDQAAKMLPKILSYAALARQENYAQLQLDLSTRKRFHVDHPDAPSLYEIAMQQGETQMALCCLRLVFPIQI
ncbi:MAG: hypothetical protein R3A45_12390 [Bdellovibrionota bacterium]